jgi:X-X-X-Leu-X-X-Gly heptad repeat protein
MRRGMGGLTDLTDGVGHLHDGLNSGKSNIGAEVIQAQHASVHAAADAAEQLLSREVKCRMARC